MIELAWGVEGAGERSDEVGGGRSRHKIHRAAAEPGAGEAGAEGPGVAGSTDEVFEFGATDVIIVAAASVRFIHQLAEAHRSVRGHGGKEYEGGFNALSFGDDMTGALKEQEALAGLVEWRPSGSHAECRTEHVF